MYRIILCAGAALLALDIAVTPARADDTQTCLNGTGDEAVAACDRIIARTPTDAVTYNDRGAAHGARGDYDRAIADFDQAIKLDPKYAVAYYNRGFAWHNKAEYDRAVADY